MVKKTNKRIMITLPARQVDWLEKFCKKHNTTMSLYIKYLLSKKAEEMLVYLRCIKNADEAREALNEAIRIAKTPWLDDDE